MAPMSPQKVVGLGLRGLACPISYLQESARPTAAVLGQSINGRVQNPRARKAKRGPPQSLVQAALC